MGDLSENFSRYEFECQGVGCCGRSAPVHPALIDGLQELRDKIGRPLLITSGFRCRSHNRKIGGSRNSYHCLGMAADVAVPGGMTMEEFMMHVLSVDVFFHGGVGRYSSWVHVDVRKDAERWKE